MKLSTKMIPLLGLVLSLFVPTSAFADVHVYESNSSNSSTNIHSESNGTSTICVNGKCTTSGGETKNTVCINGNCSTTGGDVDYQSDDGHTKVQIHNNSTQVQVSPTDTDNDDDVSPTKPEPTITVDPDIQNKINEATKEAEQQVKERVKGDQGIIEAFIKSEMESLQKLFDKLF